MINTNFVIAYLMIRKKLEHSLPRQENMAKILSTENLVFVVWIPQFVLGTHQMHVIFNRMLSSFVTRILQTSWDNLLIHRPQLSIPRLLW